MRYSQSNAKRKFIKPNKYNVKQEMSQIRVKISSSKKLEEQSKVNRVGKTKKNHWL